MLLQFNFKNFKSFKDDTTIDLTATKISEFNNHVISIANERILPVAAIFGANASGKSNVQEAFRYMSMYVINSLDYGDESDQKKKKSRFFKPTPFLFDSDSRTAESSFEVYFIDSEENGAKTYNYGFTVNSTGVCEEWLNYKSKTSRGDYKKIFYRNGNELDLSGIPSKSQENLKIALENETLIVSLGAKLKIAKLKYIRDWFINNDFADFGKPIENFFLSQLIPEGFAEDEKVRKNVVDYFASSARDEMRLEMQLETTVGRNVSIYMETFQPYFAGRALNWRQHQPYAPQGMECKVLSQELLSRVEFYMADSFRIDSEKEHILNRSGFVRCDDIPALSLHESFMSKFLKRCGRIMPYGPYVLYRKRGGD